MVSKAFTRQQLLAVAANPPPCLVGMEAFPTSNYWAREIQKLGHQVRLMAPRFVRAYVKANKNDKADAEAICEAVRRPTMRFLSRTRRQNLSTMFRRRTLQNTAKIGPCQSCAGLNIYL